MINFDIFFGLSGSGRTRSNRLQDSIVPLDSKFLSEGEQVVGNSLARTATSRGLLCRFLNQTPAS